MIKEEYVTYESAKLLKEAGFPQEGFLTYYNENGSLLHSDMRCSQRFARCTKWHAMQWLRDEHCLSVEVLYGLESCKKGANHKWGYRINNIATHIYSYCATFHLTYEEAAEAGIQAACKYLIGKS